MLVKAMRIIPTLCFCLQYDICDFQRANISRSTSSSWLFHSKSDDAYTEELEQKKLDQDRIRKRRRRNLEHWGVEMAFSSTHDYKCTPVFPSKFDAVADDAFHAIRGTLLGLQRPDPNAAVNAMHRSVLDYRPTQPHHASSQSVDREFSFEKSGQKPNVTPVARMGIEIDGAAYLLSSEDVQSGRRGTDEGRALRILSLKIAGRLAACGGRYAALQPVAVYFNSMEQTLLASNELRHLKEMSEAPFRQCLDKIQIFCVDEHTLPDNMVRRKHDKASTIGNGIILIVKPTDYNFDSPTATMSMFDSPSDDHKKFYPTIHSDIIDKLQSLLFQASASSIPAVVISPRLTELPPLQQYSTTYHYKTGPSGFEQSGFQQSSTYGGLEPPIGPTSWLLRDLIPPVYVWVGCSLDLLSRTKTVGKRRRVAPSINSLIMSSDGNQTLDMDPANVMIGGQRSFSFYSRVALTQSSMDIGHLYHLFAVKEASKEEFSQQEAKPCNLKWISSHKFIGSIKASLGRPTSEVINSVFSEWSEYQSLN